MPRSPGVGIGVIIHNPAKASQILLGLRTGSIGADTWALPGGHLEFGESFFACAVRETLEETGLQLDPESCHVSTVTNTIWGDERAEGGMAHYVTVFVTGAIIGAQQEPKIMEPDKCKEWRWMEQSHVKKWSIEQVSMTDSQREKKLFPAIAGLFTQTSYAI